MLYFINMLTEFLMRDEDAGGFTKLLGNAG